MNKKTVRDIDWNGKRALVRCDFNVPMEDGKITDDMRIESAIPTINYLREKGASLVLMSHMGRPDGEANEKYSLRPVAERLGSLLDAEVKFISCPTVVNEEIISLAKALKPSEILLLENTRFRKEETKNDKAFSKELAELGDVFVNDAFGTAHRAHSSTAGVTEFIPGVIGLLIEKEVDFLGTAVKKPKKPFVAIMGGAKVGDKIPVIESLLMKVDTLIIGGGMSYTFFKGMGFEIGKSLFDEAHMEYTKELLEKAIQLGVQILLPMDIVCGEDFSNDTRTGIVDFDKIPAGLEGMDIGPKSRLLFEAEILRAETVLWNGPMGVFEFETFSK
ncbi:MAG: phosphoglycerate kinase, partial [Anaerovoracaceae bacterium]